MPVILIAFPIPPLALSCVVARAKLLSSSLITKYSEPDVNPVFDPVSASNLTLSPVTNPWLAILVISVAACVAVDTVLAVSVTVCRVLNL